MPANTPTANLPYPLLADTPADIETAVKPLALALDPLVPTAAQRSAMAAVGGTPPGAGNKFVTVADLVAMMVPIGAIVPYAGSALPPVTGGVEWAWADGGLINAGTYAAFAGSVGHAYNGGVDPGGGMVRKPDKRGRVCVGADSFGATGAAGRLPNSPRARGQNGGEERHPLTIPELASHGHTDGSLTTNTIAAHGHGATFSYPYFIVADRPSGGTSINVPLAAGATRSLIGQDLSQTNVTSTNATATSGSHNHTVTGTTDPTGTGTPHNVLQPYEVDHYLVRVA